MSPNVRLRLIYSVIAYANCRIASLPNELVVDYESASLDLL